jgi:hypothetical protein
VTSARSQALFRYSVVDDEIIIVEPGSMKIVAVIPA